ncbi:PaaI family thioesterase [Dactylosporangium sp. CA-092794]|uniref:PaaI family thioesterase n=1 Tax=Dactylosporangium sp. CA-092794 TaxID=3239929 RepID=UPI003D8B5A8B
MAIDLYRTAAGLAPGEFAELTPQERPAAPAGSLIDAFGLVLTHVGRGRSRVAMTVGAQHLNQRGIAQAGAVVGLADAAAGWAAYTALEHGRFTTLELRCSMLRPAVLGDQLVAEAVPVHLGRRTLVFEVDVHRSGDPARPLARFGCTQLVLDEPAAAPDVPRDRP